MSRRDKGVGIMQKIFNSRKIKENRQKLRKSATPQEVILWSILKRKQLGYKFRRQYSIGKYIVDFYCPERKLIIELDGWQHKENKQYDHDRSGYFRDLGLSIVRFWNNDVNNNIEGVILRIEECLE